MLRTMISLVVAAAAMSPAAAVASTSDGRFAVEAGGQTSCSVYLKARSAQSPDYAMMIAFLDGYLTAANRYEPDTFDLTPWHTPAALSLIVDDYCGRHGADTLAIVAQKLTIAFKPQRLAQFSPLVEVRNGKAATAIYRSILERTQTALKEKGLYRGEITGAYSPEFMAALLDYQKSAKLEPSGIPDSGTVWKLLTP